MTRAVLLDALGTLVELPPPAPAFAEELAARGVRLRESEAAWAIRAEIAFYRAHMHHARDADGLRSLRDRCTDVLRQALPAHARGVDDLQGALLGALRFRAYPDAERALRRWRAAHGGGLRLVVASNWDVSLHEVLERTGLDELLDGAVTSAEVGAAKPDGRLFAAALAVAGADPASARHVGDDVEADVEGARAAGIRPLLVVRGTAAARTGTVPSLAGVDVVSSLDDADPYLGL